jgi:hypothetical protein
VSIGVSQADLMLFFNGFFDGVGQAAQNMPEPWPTGRYSQHRLAVK